MNLSVTSKENILKASRKLIREQGWPAINIRCVAASCGISVGTVYNYFDSKEALMKSAVESIWYEIFHRQKDEGAFLDIQSCITWIYDRIEYGCKQYPDFFNIHSLSFMQRDTSDEKEKMRQTWQHISEELCIVLRHDPKVRPDAFNSHFTVEKCADVLFSLMLAALLRRDYNPDPVLEIVRRTLY